MAKPFDKEELLVWLEKLLERQQRMAFYFSKKIKGGKGAEPPEVAIQDTVEMEDVFIQKVRQIVEDNFSDEDFSLPQLCQKIGMSRSQLFRKMKALIDESPSDFIRNYRLNEAKKLLETTSFTVSEVAWKVGYKDLAHFSKSFQDAFGIPPTIDPPTVTHPICTSPVGTIVVNATGGTFDYSVDDGNIWQPSSTFSNLAPGSYNIKVRHQSNPACMAAYGGNPVVLNTPTGCPGGKTLDFDGTDDYVALPANLSSSLTDFTFEAWVYWDGSNYWQRIMDFGQNTNVYMYLTPKGTGTDMPIFAITTGSSGGEERIYSNVAATIGQWQHYAVTLKDATNTGTLYIDGTQVGQNTNMTLTPAALGNLLNNYLETHSGPTLISMEK